MMTVSLEGKVKDLNGLHFVDVEWSRKAARLVIVHCRWQGERQLSLRMDLDKRAILNSDELDVPSDGLRDRAMKIWKIVADTRKHERAA
jgi:hypothetical protein